MKRDPKKVFLGIAIGNGQEGVTRWETSMSLIRLLQAGIPDYSFVLCPGGGCDVAHARNLMVHECLTRTDCGLLAFVDSDVGFLPEQLIQLLMWFSHPEISLCAGLYPLKGKALRWSFGLWNKPAESFPTLWEVGEVCTGFLGVRVNLFEDMILKYPESEYVLDERRFAGETGHELFAMGPVAARDWNQNGQPFRRRMPEDFMFSMRASDMGHKIYVDPSIQCGHIGTFNFLDLHAKSGTEVALGRQ